MSRLFDVFEKKKIFKLILGLGNRSCEEIYETSKIYALAGCDMFDINASERAIEALKRALKDAGREDALICISIGLEGDVHTRKAVVNEKKCSACAKCLKKCPCGAIVMKEGRAFVQGRHSSRPAGAGHFGALRDESAAENANAAQSAAKVPKTM